MSQTSLSHHKVSCQSCSLSQICLPKGFSDDEVDMIAQYVKKAVKLPKANYLFHKGDKLRGIFAIKAGSIKTVLSSATGEEQILEFYLPGDVIGVDGWGSGQYNCDAVALTDTYICHIPIEYMMEDLALKIPKLNSQLLQITAKELANNQNLSFSLGRLPAEGRMALFLMSLSMRYSARGLSETSFNLPMTRQDLSNYLGLAVETISRIFFRMQKHGVLAVNRRSIEIKDKEELVNMAQLNCNQTTFV